MRSIAEGLVASLLATAEVDGLLFFNLKGDRLKVGFFMRSIAEGLVGRTTTATPIIGTGL